MAATHNQTDVCPTHGKASKTETCTGCYNAYMRSYMRSRRIKNPQTALLDRARQRAVRRNLDFSIDRSDVMVPVKCPALGISISVGEKRSDNSPSLDRISPHLGYVRGNVRVLSDRANRLKGLRGPAELRLLAKTSDPCMAKDYAKVADYVERETLLAEVRQKSNSETKEGKEWKKIFDFMERVFSLVN